MFCGPANKKGLKVKLMRKNVLLEKKRIIGKLTKVEQNELRRMG